MDRLQPGVKSDDVCTTARQGLRTEEQVRTGKVIEELWERTSGALERKSIDWTRQATDQRDQWRPSTAQEEKGDEEHAILDATRKCSVQLVPRYVQYRDP